MIQVVSLTGALPYTGKHRITAVLRGDVTNQLLNQNCLSYAGTAEQSDLSALLIRTKQIHYLDTGLQQLLLRSLLLKFRCGTVNRLIGYPFRSRFIVNWLTQNIEDPPQSLFPNRNGNGGAGCNRIHSPHQTIGASHGNASDRVITQMLGDLHGQLTALSGRNANCFVNLRQLSLIKADIQYRSDNLGNLAPVFSCHFYLFPPTYVGQSLSYRTLSSQISDSLSFC